MSEPVTQPHDHESTPESEAPQAAPDSIAELKRERDALQDRLLRSAAEFDNYRKRVERERRDLSEYVASEVLTDVLPVLDNFERAMQAPALDLEAYRTGVELIHKQFVEALRRRGVVALETAGKDFDPNVHQAVVREVVRDHRDGEILQELQRGYMIGDRLLRPAMVKVATQS